MSRLTLTHLTFVGAAAEPAAVEFAPGMTLVCGPSDTGKSFIVDALDFMMGATTLKEIPERQGYSTALLGIALPSGEAVTLSRSVDGGGFGLFRGDIRSGPLGTPDEVLSPVHSGTSQNNVSRFLLSAVGLDDRRVRKNVRNETDSLSFRNLAHLCIVDETEMQSEVPPALTGQYVFRTKEISVLKLLLQDEDDSELVPVQAPAEKRRISGAKVEVLEGMLSELELRLADQPSEAEVRAQLERLNAWIMARTASIEGVASERHRLVTTRTTLQDQVAEGERRLSEATALASRFELLLAQYNSDLARLEMISEAGSLLGYFDPGPCVFCGAEVEHQHLTDLCEGDDTYLAASVSAEQTKTAALRDDLVEALKDVGSERRNLTDRLVQARAGIVAINERVAALDAELQPDKESLNELLDLRSSLEATMNSYEQVHSLEQMKRQIASESKAETVSAAAALSLSALREFSGELARRLRAWGFPDADDVRYDRSEQDIVAGDQFRSAHGKGVRAVLHAAFTVALAQYCFDRDLPHPGFVVLDSPLVTYRAPDLPDDVDGEAENALDEFVIGAFYADLQRNFSGQVIIMENTDPPVPLDVDSVDIRFTKTEGFGRYGFFPVPSEGRLA